MTSETDLRFYIEHLKEERYIEYKGAMMWTGNDSTKLKIAQAMMAMCNLRNGGVIVVGLTETKRGVWEADGMSEEQARSFNQDDIAQWVNECAVPAVQFTVKTLVYDKRRFVIIQVREFDSVPVVCRKQKTIGSQTLRPGSIYYRSNRKYESAPISSEEDMRELIGLAVDKGVARELKRLRELGLVGTDSQVQETSALKFEREREGL